MLDNHLIHTQKDMIDLQELEELEIGDVLKHSLAIKVFLFEEDFDFLRLVVVLINLHKCIAHRIANSATSQGETSELVLHFCEQVKREHHDHEWV